MSYKYKIKQISVKNFKGFDNEKFYDFDINVSSGLTILSGPNGFGKTTFFDVVELFFRKDITRLAKDIEGVQHNKSNIFLNDKNANAYLILTLENINKDVNQYLLVIAKGSVNLNANLTNVAIYKCLQGFDRSSIDNYLVDDNSVLRRIENFEKEIGYSKDYFNVYYYVSQAESVHFLKNKMADREETMNTLLGIKKISDLHERLRSVILGKKIDSPVWIRKKIIQNNEDKEKLAAEIKQHKKSSTLEKQDYIQIFSNEMLEKFGKFKWDEKDFDVSQYSENSIVGFLNKLLIASVNYEDYKVFIENERINKIILNETGTIENYLLCKELLLNNRLSLDLMQKKVNRHNNIIAINNQLASVMSYLENKDEEKFDEQFYERLVKALEDMGDEIHINTDLNSLILGIKKLRMGLGEHQEKILNLTNIRKNLVARLGEYASLGVVKEKQCPLCGHNFETEIFLKENIDSLSKELDALGCDKEKQFHEQQSMLVDICKEIVNHISKYAFEKEKLENMKAEKGKLDEISKNNNEIERINNLIDLLGNVKSIIDIDTAKACLEAKKKSYINSDFPFIYNTEKLNEIYSMFENSTQEEEVLNEFLQLKNKKERIEQKKKYIHYQYYLHDNKAYSEKIKLIKEKIEYGIKLNLFKEELSKIVSLLKEEMDEHKKTVSKNLRVPLLIFTGKLLQDYQNGLGVFIHEEQMRFVPSGKPGDDILNTFSSGQLSAFVLAFLLVMNSVYSKIEDNVDFLLIDDPVQTMDDINIASFIELLRNNYRDKQIILSTHEVDKEKYMLYKFIKFGIQVDSFNVKEKLYTGM